MDFLRRTPAFLAFLSFFFAPVSFAGIPTLSFQDLSDQDITPQGKSALSLNQENWRHAETPHFVYHFTDEKQAETIYLHAEVQYQWIKDMFGVEKDTWKKKGHIFIFEDKQVWEKFNTRGGEKFLGFAGFTDGWELFMQRAPYWLSPQRTLAHEITHIILFRFLDGPIPLCLNEGFAEFMATKAVAVQAGGNEYNIRTLQLIPKDEYISLRELTQARSYPSNIQAFYQESELLARFLILNYGSKNFYSVLKRASQGEDFEKVLDGVYDVDLPELEEKFKTYAIQPSA